MLLGTKELILYQLVIITDIHTERDLANRENYPAAFFIKKKHALVLMQDLIGKLKPPELLVINI